MKKITAILALILISASIFGARKTIVLRLNPNVHCLDEKRRGKYLMTRLKPKTRYFVRMKGRAWLSGDTDAGADPVWGMITYYRVFKNGKSIDQYKIMKHNDRFVFTSAAKNPIFVGFIMEIFARRNNRGSFVITLRELGPAR